MRTSHFLWASSIVVLLSLGAGAGCGGDDDEGGSSKGGTASGGKGGTSSGGSSTGGSSTGGSSTGGSSTGGTAGTSTGGTAGSSTGGTAGSAGDGGTTLTCAAYCTTIMANCNTAATKQYADEATCLKACEAFPVGTSADQGGNTLGCRVYHAGNAAGSGAAEHCPHAGPAGDGVCGSNCDGYCSLMTKWCTSAYASEAECKTKCANITGATAVDFSSPQPGGNTLFCRIYHALNAASDSAQPSTHCGHAQEVATDVCK